MNLSPPASLPPAVRVALVFGGQGSIRYEGPEEFAALLDALAPFCPDGFSGELRLRVLFAAPVSGRDRGWSEMQRADLFVADQDAAFVLFALRDLRRRLEAQPSVFLQVARAEPHCTLYLGAPDSYRRKLGKWFVVGLLATIGGLRFVHASAVTDGRTAALIIGAQGSGKSTLAAAAVIAGLELVAEGVSLVDGSGRVLPFFMDGEPTLRLGALAWQEVQPLLPAGWPAPDTYPSHADGVAEKIVLRLRALLPTHASVGNPSVAPLPIAAAWLPRIAGETAGRLSVDRLPRRAAMAEIGGELEDGRVRALRGPLSALRWLERRPSPEERWQDDFPRLVMRVRGIEDFAALVDRLRLEGVRLGS